MQKAAESTCLGIDIGGSSVKYGLVDRKGRITERGSFATYPTMSRDEFTSLLQRAGEEAKSKGATGVGISALGFIDSVNGILTGGVENLPFLNGYDFKEVFSSAYQSGRICVNNDCDSFALGERWKGNAQGVEDFFCIALGTGIGGSVVTGGKILKGKHLRAGEIGYLNYVNEEDYLERIYSTQCFMKLAAKKLGTEQITGVEFMNRVREKDAACMELLEDWMRALGKVIANVILLLDVELVIIGGGVSQSSDVLIPLLQSCTDACLPETMRGECTIRPAKFFNDSAVIGAVSPLFAETCR